MDAWVTELCWCLTSGSASHYRTKCGSTYCSFCFHAISSLKYTAVFFCLLVFCTTLASVETVRDLTLVSIRIKVVKSMALQPKASLYFLPLSTLFLFPAFEVNPMLNHFYFIWSLLNLYDTINWTESWLNLIQIRSIEHPASRLKSVTLLFCPLHKRLRSIRLCVTAGVCSVSMCPQGFRFKYSLWNTS